jgi:predicted nuclease with TOPRIM domain
MVTAAQLQAEKDRIDELVKQVKKLTEREAELEAKNAAQAEKIASVEKEQKNAPAADALWSTITKRSG